MSNPIKLLQVAKSSGGVGIYTRRLVKALDRERYQITVVCLAEGADELAADLSQLKNVEAISLPMKDQIDPLTDFFVYSRLFRIIRRGRFDLIHAHTSKPGFLTRVAAIGTGIPVIYQPANFAFHDGVSKKQAAFYSVLERLAARHLTKKIIALCDGERELARRYSVGADDQFITIHTGIELTPFNRQFDRSAVRASLGIDADVQLVGTVARLTEAKAPADFIRAAALVNQTNPSAHFLWVGDGALMDESLALVKSLGLENVFHFAGFRSDIPDVLNALDVFVLSSHWEGFPLALLEAMAARLPVISTRVMGATEAVLDGETGFLVPIGDVPSLAEAINKLIGSSQQARMFGERGRLRVETDFPYSKMVARIEDLYETIYRLR